MESPRFYPKQQQSPCITNNVFYKSLSAAVEAAEENATIILLADGETATVSKAVTIEKNGHTATITAGEGYAVEETDEAYIVAEKTEEDLTDEALKFASKAINLAAYIGAQFEIDPEAVAEAGYTSVYVTVVNNGEETVLDMNLAAGLQTEAGLQRYVFEHVLAAKEMADELVLTVYGVKDGVTYTGETAVWSIKDGALDRLDMYYPYINHATYGELYRARCTLVVDMLNYGAEAQERFSYNTENPANAGLKEEYAALATAGEPEITAENTAATTAVNQLYGYNLGVEENVNIQFTFRLDNTNYDEYTVKITWGEEIYEYSGEDLVPMNGYPKFVTVVFDKLSALDMRETVTVELYQNGIKVSDTYTASIEGTAKMMIDNGKNVDVIKAMMKYGDAASVSLGN